MKAIKLAGALVVAMFVWPQPATAQRPDNVDPNPVVDRELRMQRMEQLLEQAVTRGVRVVEQQLPTGGPPLLFFAGPVQARGFAIDGYGMFFDVEYPVVRRSLLWSMNALNGLDSGMAAVLRNLRSRTIAEMEAQLQESGLSPASTGAAGLRPATDADEVPREQGPVADPSELYVSALTGALADAMVAFGTSLGVGRDDWVVVAARDGRGRADPRLTGPRQTLQLRVSGSDLEAFREGRLTEDELRQRIHIP